MKSAKIRLFSSQIDIAQSSSINFTWQVGDKYEIILENLNFFQNFLIGTFSILECAQNLAVNSKILPKPLSCQFLRIRIIQKLVLR